MKKYHVIKELQLALKITLAVFTILLRIHSVAHAAIKEILKPDGNYNASSDHDIADRDFQ